MMGQHDPHPLTGSQEGVQEAVARPPKDSLRENSSANQIDVAVQHAAVTTGKPRRKVVSPCQVGKIIGANAKWDKP